jgi:hypothetical protein
MGTVKKLKKSVSRSRLGAERAEAAAERSEAALAHIIEITQRPAPGSPAGDANSRPPAHTKPRG